jgi:hypothetical protein
MSDWLDDSIAQFSEFEPPLRYYYWSLLASVSAIVKDRVYIDRFSYKLYPNIYVLLFGPSAVKKGPPIGLAKDVVTRVDNTRVINGRASIEAIIKELGTVQSRPNKQILKDSAGFIVSSELSSAIISNTNSLDILTDLFDRIYNDGEWVYRLKNSEPIRLKNPTVTWLAGTNEALFREFVPEKNLKGGLIGRTFVISEHQGNGLNSLMYAPQVMPDKAKIAEAIKPLSLLCGEFHMDDEVRREFDFWYQEFQTKIAPKLEDDTGTIGRIADHILKVGMLIALARRQELVIRLEDLEESMQKVLPLLAPTKRVTQSVKIQEISMAEKRGLVLHHLANCQNFSDSRIAILRRHVLKMDHEDLDRVVSYLEQSQILLTSHVGGQGITYTLNMNKPGVAEYVKNYQR